MIPARKRPVFARWFARQAGRRLLRTFGQVRLAGGMALGDRLERGPVLVVSNHTAWWDSLVALLLADRLVGFDGYALMDARNLRRLPFFAWVGGFGFDPGVPGDGAAAVRHGARLLDRPGRLVWVFPEGREIPDHVRPLHFARGASVMARLAKDAAVVPVGLSYAFGKAERPDVFVSIGRALSPADRVSPEAQARAVADELDRIAGARHLEAEGVAAVDFVAFGRSRPDDPATRVLSALTARAAAPPDRPRGDARPT